MGAPNNLVDPIIAFLVPHAKKEHKPIITSSEKSFQVLPSFYDSTNIEIESPISLTSCPSVQDFKVNFWRINVPAVITDAVQDWKAVQKWTDLKYFDVEFGFRTVPIEIGNHGNSEFTEKLMTISEFLSSYIIPDIDRFTNKNKNNNPKQDQDQTENQNKVGYLAQHALFDQLPELKNDFSVPAYCRLGSLTHVNAWFGTSGTVTPLHFDSYDNIFVQVFGYKYVRLYDKSQTPYLYKGSRKTLKAHDTMAQNNISLVSVESPDLEQFPLFSKATFSEAIIGPGEMIFIPRGFWHFVKSLSPSFSISFWF